MLVPFGYAVLMAVALFPSILLTLLTIPLALQQDLLSCAILLSLILPASALLAAISLTAISIVLIRLGRLGQVDPRLHGERLALVRFTVYHALHGLLSRTILPIICNTWIIILYYRALGAKIGSDTYINTPFISECNLVAIGSGTMIGAQVAIIPHSAEGGTITVAPVTIGNRVSIGAGTIILPGATVEDDVTIAANSMVPKHRILKSGRTYAGVPARVVASQEALLTLTQSGGSAGQQVLESISTEQANSILVEGYKLRNGEAADMGRFMVTLCIGVLGIVFSGIFYSVINNRKELLAGLPPLVGGTMAMMLNLSTSMLKNAYKMCEIESYFGQRGIKALDWELRFGGLGRTRLFDLDTIFINSLFLLALVGGVWLTWSGYLIDRVQVFAGLSTRRILLGIDAFVVSWLLFGAAYYGYLRVHFARALDRYRESLQSLTGPGHTCS